ncbi:hypothetical protein [Glutamicibacter sp.]|jgi:hypothetical protein|uniref:hypothetical protein n=1 Tax=Glutamicibacter sp. TaxID=1931995 RepID=UPI002B45ECDF|nr:hypothetical protein [Glutamicibacter sp.]HJX79990.1 hypothetical protein [Glutamicibacter sp.]
MPDKNLHLALSNTQISDLLNALEDHHKYFLDQADHATLGFGLDAAYWSTRAQEVNEVRQLILQSVKT